MSNTHGDYEHVHVYVEHRQHSEDGKNCWPHLFYHTSDLVPPHVSGKVMFIDSTPSVEIVLFQLSQVY